MQLLNARMAIVAAALVALAGCGETGYHLRPPYNPKIRTIYVPIFKSNQFRRDINFQLTQLVIEEIERRTPFKVVADPDGADARLEGMISYSDKALIVENPNNLPRHLLAMMQVNVTFVDNHTKSKKTKEIPSVGFSESAAFYPEIGETTQLGYEKTMQRLARDIVNTMEEPWGDEYVKLPEVEEVEP